MNDSTPSSSSHSAPTSSYPPMPQSPQAGSSRLVDDNTFYNSDPSPSSSTASTSTSSLYPLEPTTLAPPPLSLREPPNADILPAIRPTLSQFRHNEGATLRASKLRSLWDSLPPLPEVSSSEPSTTEKMKLPGQDTLTALSPERADRLSRLYEEELVKRCNEKRPDARLWGGADELEPEMRSVKGKGIAWSDFRRFLWDQERELWDIFQDFDKNGDGRLDAVEMRAALSRSGIDITPNTVKDLVRFLASGASTSPMGAPSDLPAVSGGQQNVVDDVMYITFQEFRDFLIMLPRKATPYEIYKFYQVRKRFSDGRGAARVDKEGDLNVSFPKSPGSSPNSTASGFFGNNAKEVEDGDEFEDTVLDPAPQEDRHEAWRFLLAGGVAGAVSRTVTAPFDRLKVYLITTPKEVYLTSVQTPSSMLHPLKSGFQAVTNLWEAVIAIYKDGQGLKAFWVGNGLNVTKIFPESAIKFVSYEQSKKFLAKYWDKVSDPADLSPSSRFISGGIGGITSQFSIYALETLKTRIQSETGPAKGWRAVVGTAKYMWKNGGVKTYYRGLTLGLIGVFPYSAIDMGTYETLKTAYCRSTGKDEPEVYAVLSFGALSGSIGAATVYPINLLRTRLQASGSTGHPQHYTGFVDVLQQTLKKEGPRGLYKGLLPSILKVGPAVGVSWIVYEDMKRRMGV